MLSDPISCVVIHGGLAGNPRRVGHELTLKLAGLYSARRGDFRVLYRISEGHAEVVIVNIDHRSDVYRRRKPAVYAANLYRAACDAVPRRDAENAASHAPSIG